MRTTPLESSVLKLLQDREGKVVTRDQLMDHIYGEREDEPGAKILDVCVCRLRKKLARAGWGGAIKSQRSLGYMLVQVPTPRGRALEH
jgi:two-component system cell cycle response regulator CtrA